MGPRGQEQVTRQVGRQVVRAVALRRRQTVGSTHPETIDVGRRRLTARPAPEGRRLAEAEDPMGRPAVALRRPEALGSTTPTEADLVHVRRPTTTGVGPVAAAIHLAAAPAMATAMVTEATVVLMLVGLGRAWPVLVQGRRPEVDPTQMAQAVARLLEGRRLATP